MGDKGKVTAERLARFLEDEAFSEATSLVVSILSCIRQPVPLTALDEMIGDVEQRKGVLGGLSPLLRLFESGEVCFADDSVPKRFLSDDESNNRVRIDLGLAKRKLSEFCAEYATKSVFAARNVIFHLCETEDFERLAKMLCSFEWLHGVILDAACNPRNIVSDADEHFKEIFRFPDALFVIRALEKSLHGLDEDVREMRSQLCGRLSPNHPVVEEANTVSLLRHRAIEINGQLLTPADNPLRKLLIGHEDFVEAIAIDEEIIVTASWDKSVRVWSRTTGKVVEILLGHTDSVNAVALDEEFIVSGGGSARSSRDESTFDCSVKVWDRFDYELVTSLEGHSGMIESLATSRDLIISSSEDCTMKFWSKETLKLVQTFQEVSPCSCLAVENDFLVAGFHSGEIKCWRLSGIDHEHTFLGHKRKVTTVDIEEDYIVSASDDQTIKIWLLGTRRLMKTLMGHEDVITVIKIRDGLIVSGSCDKTMRIWTVADDDAQGKIYHDCSVEALAIDDVSIVSGSGNQVQVWSRAAQYFHKNKDPVNHSEKVTKAILHNNYLLTASDDRTIKVWDSITGKNVWTFTGHRGGISDIAVENESGVLVSASSDKTIRVWSLRKKFEHLKTLNGHSSPVFCVAINKGRIVSGAGSSVKLWPFKKSFLQKGALKTFETNFSLTTSIDLNENFVISGGNSTVACLFSLSNNNSIHLAGHFGVITAVKLIEKFAVTASADRTVKIWSVSGEQIHSFLFQEIVRVISRSWQVWTETYRSYDLKEDHLIAREGFHVTENRRKVNYSIQGESVVGLTMDHEIEHLVTTDEEERKAFVVVFGRPLPISAPATRNKPSALLNSPDG